MKANTKRKVQIAAVVACLMAAAGASQAQTNTSTNLPVVDVRATDPYALEGTSTAAFTLIRHGPTNTALVVALGLSGTASNGVDYQTVASSVTIPAGFLAVDVPIVPIVVNTRNKTVVLKLDTNSTYNLDRARSAEVKIVDDTFNLPKPTVDILSPTNGSTYTVPAIFTVTADASDSDFAITSVSFYADEFFLGRATNSP